MAFLAGGEPGGALSVGGRAEGLGEGLSLRTSSVTSVVVVGTVVDAVSEGKGEAHLS